MTPLNNDMSRCYGVGCEKKESCRRFLTIEVDDERDANGWPIVRSYAATLLDKSTMNCDEFILTETRG